MTLLQNIKKKEAGGAKARPMGGGLLPPPPGAKAGGLLPPPVGQQAVSAVQTNAGNHCAFVSNSIFQNITCSNSICAFHNCSSP